MRHLIGIFSIQVLGTSNLSYGLGEIVGDLFGRSGRVFLNVMTAGLSGVSGVMSALLALVVALSFEQVLSPFAGNPLGITGRAYLVVLLPVVLAVVLGLNLSQRLAECRNA